jgi:hypothetical protein
MSKIAIVGTTASLMDAPYKDESWEIWGLNGAYSAMPRWDKWFDMHSLQVLKDNHKPAYFDFLAKAGNKLTLNAEYEEYPDARVFPYKELVEKHGRYFSNTIAWLIALAIEQEPEEIGIWGVNMAQDTEYAHQRPCCEYFLGMAKGVGIKVTVPKGSELLKSTHLYGVEDLPDVFAKLPDKEREIRAFYNEASHELDVKIGNLNSINGYIQGQNEFAGFVDGKIKGENIIESINGYKAGKMNEMQQEALQINSEITHLKTKKAQYQGALDYHQYFKTNWG